MGVFKIGVLGSGRGTNFEAIAREIQNGTLGGVEIAVVISDCPDAPILEKARERNIKALHISPGKFKTWLEPAVEAQYARVLKEHGVQLVVLAGFMRVVKKPLLDVFPNRIINIHPSLLPSFPGLEAWAQALNYGARVAGCTVHFVNEQLDSGPIILQEAVPVLDTDTVQTLHERIHQKEYALYPKAISLIAQGRLHVEGRRVKIQNEKEK